MIIRRSITSPAWWLFGTGLAFAAWWGLPLIQVDRLENHFYGLFWYSMLGLGAIVWALPVEQRASAQSIERRYSLFGLIPVWKQVWAANSFKAIRIEREANLIGPDSLWVMLIQDEENSLVFAQFRTLGRGTAAAQQMAADLATQTGLSVEPSPES